MSSSSPPSALSSSSSKISHLPAAVVTHCFAFCDSVGHSRCAQVCRWFRALALLPAGFPDAVRVPTSAVHLAAASPALAQMRPRRRLEICVTDAVEWGSVAQLLRGPMRVRHIALAAAANVRDWSLGMNNAFQCDDRNGSSGRRSSPTGGGGGVSVDASVAAASDDADKTRIETCVRLDVSMRVLAWNPWFPAFIARLPNLAHLELEEFAERQSHLLLRGAPQLTALHIERDSMDPHGKRAADGFSDFAHTLLTGLARLRSLTLAYASVPYRDLLVAADRLETLRVRELNPRYIMSRHSHSYAPPNRPRPTRMERLTRVTAALADLAASRRAASLAEILARMPHVRGGRLAFQATYAPNSTVQLVAHFDHSSEGGPHNNDGGGDGGGDGNGGGNRERDDDNDVRVAWYYYSYGLAYESGNLASMAAGAMAKLCTGWRGHVFDPSVATDARRQIELALPLRDRVEPESSRRAQVAAIPEAAPVVGVATPGFARLPDAVAALCFALGDSTAHARCAQVCVRFRRIALLPAGFPDSLRILAPRHWASASPAVAQMRPRRLLEVRVSAAAASQGGEFGLVGRVLSGQMRVRHLVIALAAERGELVTPTDDGGSGSSGSSGSGSGGADRRPPVFVAAVTATDNRAVDMNYAVNAYASLSDNGIDRVGHLPECRRLDVRVCVAFWRPWFPQLTERLPRLECLELLEFPEEFPRLLCDSVPQLTALRIERNAQDNVHQRPSSAAALRAADSNFGHTLLSRLVRLRSLALPYSSMPYRDLLVAADRLESLEVRELSASVVARRHANTYGAHGQKPPHMTRLTHLRTAMVDRDAQEILERVPHVRRGQIEFKAHYYWRLSDARIVAQFDVARRSDDACDDTGSGAETDAGGNGECAGGGGRRSIPAESGGGGGDDVKRIGDESGARVAWRYFPDGLTLKGADFTSCVCRAVTKLRVAARAEHEFAVGVTAETRRQILAALSPVVGGFGTSGEIETRTTATDCAHAEK